MSNDFATALRRALGKMRASDPGAATTIIQEALGGRSAPAAQPQAECGPCSAFAAAGGAEEDTGTGSAPRTAPGTSAFSGLPGLSGLADLPGLKGFSGASGLGGASELPGMGSLPGLRSRNGTQTRAPVPEGARVEMRHHAVPAGARDVRLFVPSPRAEGYAGLVIMLHGCTQSPEDFALGTGMDLAAEKAGFVVAYPGQTGAHNMQSCWNWFRPEDQSRGRGEPEILATLATALATEFDLGGRVYAAGLSAGGAMAAVLADTHPDLIAAVGVHSGLPAGAAHDVPGAFAAMRGQGAEGRAPKVPAIVFHGTADATVSVRNAHRLVFGSGVETSHQGNGRRWTCLTTPDASELWLVEGAGHAWFGGEPAGSYADPAGPDASSEMLRFFQGTQTRP